MEKSVEKIKKWHNKKLREMEPCEPRCEWHKGWDKCYKDIISLLTN